MSGFNAASISDVLNDKHDGLSNVRPPSASPPSHASLSLSVLSSLLRYRAHYAFDGEDGELTFRDGDVITLIEDIDDEWGRGSLNGCTGLFPLNFVQLVQESPARKSTPEPPGI